MHLSYNGDTLSLSEILRVVFVRIGNFPAIGTRIAIKQAISNLPWRLAAEEVSSSERRTVIVNGQEIQLTDFQSMMWKRLSGVEKSGYFGSNFSR